MISDFIRFLEDSPSVFHVVRAIGDRLRAAGFKELDERISFWRLKPGGSYFVTRNGSSIFSFRMPSKRIRAIHIMASHSDSPGFKIKPEPEIESAGCIKLNIEGYGGMLKSTWFDRPLTVAGRIIVDSPAGIEPRLVYADRDLLVIPSLAIHMNREVNEKPLTNVQTDMQPLFAAGAEKGGFMRMVAGDADVLDADLFLVNRTKPFVWGPEDEFISAPKLDDLMCVYGTLAGFLKAEVSETILQMHCVFDNEEVGSRSKQGAGSTFLADCISRIREEMGLTVSEIQAACQCGMMLSADNVHAVHPNFTDKADPVSRPAMNGGIVLKYQAGQLYTTDAVSGAWVRKLCAGEGIPVQTFVNRSDMRGGTTLGSIANTQLSMNTADIGLAQLAMHSSCETAGAKDLGYLAGLARVFAGVPVTLI